MKRVWGHVLTGLTLTAGVAVTGAVVAACVHDDSTIFVSEVLAPQFVTAGMTCTYTADPTQSHITYGILDAAVTDAYSAEFLVGNQIVPQGNPNQPDTETSIVNIQGAVIRIVDAAGNQLTTYTQPAGATIPPSSGTTPGYSPVSMLLLDPGTVQGLGITGNDTVQLVSYARFFGKTLGGDSVETNEFGFPIDVCYGCLITYTNNPNFETPNCVGTSASSSASTTSVPCILGQDFDVPCSACSTPGCQPKPVPSGTGDAGTD